MKNKFSAILLAALMLLTVILGGCGNTAPVTDGTEAADETDAPAQGTLDIVKDGKSDFTIIRMEDNHKSVAAKQVELRDVIAEVTGVTLEYTEGFVKYGDEVTDEKQLVIGHADVLSDADVLSGVPLMGYAVRTVGNRIGASGWTNDTICLAADELIRLVREYGKEGSLSIPVQDATFTRPMTEPRHELQENEFVLTYYWGLSPADCTDENVRTVAEAGFTRMQINRSDAASDEETRAAVLMAEKYGLDVSLYFQGRLGSFIRDEEALTQESADAEVQSIIDTFGDLENIAEWYIIDEPHLEDMADVGMVLDAFHRLDPTRRCMVNLLPGNYSNHDDVDEPGRDPQGQPYYDYVKMLTELDADIVYFDRYNFYGNPPAFRSDDGYFDNMLVVADAALRSGLPAGMCVQNYAVDETSAPMNREQLLWGANTCLAYGYRSVTYFTYHSCNYGGFVDENNVPNEQYYALKEIAPDILAVGNYLAQYKLEMIFHLKTNEVDGAPKYIPYGPLGEVDGTNALISFYNDGSFLITNFNWNTGADNNVITLAKTEVDGNLEWFDPADSSWKDAGESEEIEVSDFAWTLSIPAADALLLRAVK